MSECVDLTRTVLGLLASGDLDGAVEYIDDDFISNEAASLPYPGTYRGKDGFRELIVALGQAWDKFDFEIHDILGSVETAAVIETISGEVAGEPFTMPVIEIWRAKAGRIIEATPYYHDTHLLWELGRRAQ